MKGIDEEQRAAAELERQNQAAKEREWARAKRDVLLMRHPTNWADYSLMQVRVFLLGKRANGCNTVERVTIFRFSSYRYAAAKIRYITNDYT